MSQSATKRNHPIEGPAEAEPEASLFRQEALDQRKSQWLGTVLLEPRLSFRISAAAALVFLSLVLTFLVFGSYTRKAKISGWIVPQMGLVRVFAPQPGVIAAIHVHEGDNVRKGMPLLALSGELRTETLGASRAEAVERLTSRRDSLTQEKRVQAGLFDQQKSDLNRRLAATREQKQHLGDEIRLQSDRLRLSETIVARDRTMRARDLISLPRFEQSQQDRIDQASRLQTLRRSDAALQNELGLAEAALHELPWRQQTQMGELQRNVAAIEQELAEAEARRQTVITAPQDGIVSALQAETGGAATVNAPLLSIVPAGSKLEVHLFSPSRSVGFVQAGQHVMLRYQAFPYQKFGSYDGLVTSVSASSLSPSELPQQLSGLTSLYQANEPVYRIIVQLGKQSVDAYGEAVPLRPGMQLEADVLLERRRLIEWIFDPVYALARK